MVSRANQSQGRGFFAIGIEHTKTPANVGTLMRSAVCFGASYDLCNRRSIFAAVLRHREVLAACSAI